MHLREITVENLEMKFLVPIAFCTYEFLRVFRLTNFCWKVSKDVKKHAEISVTYFRLLYSTLLRDFEIFRNPTIQKRGEIL